MGNAFHPTNAPAGRSPTAGKRTHFPGKEMETVGKRRIFLGGRKALRKIPPIFVSAYIPPALSGKGELGGPHPARSYPVAGPSLQVGKGREPGPGGGEAASPQAGAPGSRGREEAAPALRPQKGSPGWPGMAAPGGRRAWKGTWSSDGSGSGTAVYLEVAVFVEAGEAIRHLAAV